MNKKTSKIMACVDFSDYTLMVLEYAVELAKDSGAQVVVYNVIHQKEICMVENINTYTPNFMNVEEYVKYLKKDRQGMIKDLIKTHFFDEKSFFSYKIDVGIPFDQVLKTVETEMIDLIVMGNKGWGNISRILFGSAAEKVFRHSPVPVVSVRDRKRFKRPLPFPATL